jgi:hypothetical protein
VIAFSERYPEIQVAHTGMTDERFSFQVFYPNGARRVVHVQANDFERAERDVVRWAETQWAEHIAPLEIKAALALRAEERRERRMWEAQMHATYIAEAERRRARQSIDYPARNARIVAMRSEGRTFRALAAEFDLTPERVRQIVIVDARKKRKAIEKWHADRANLGRPIDMGGRRDVWQEFTPETAFS